MKLTITTKNNQIFKFSGRTIADSEEGIFSGRILNGLELSQSFSDLGSNLSTLRISLANYDDKISTSTRLWGANVRLVLNDGSIWKGKITGYISDGQKKLSITATERTAPELRLTIPNEFVRLVTVDENVHASALNTTLPLVVGGTVSNPIPVRGILKNKANAVYCLCVGEIQQIVKIRVGNTTYTREEAESLGYRCYTGAPSQTNEAGFAYIQITDETKRRNSDGSYVEIGAEVIGLKLGNHSIEECRNGARFLYYLLTTPSAGVCGWGLGIDSEEIDTVSFNTAIAQLDVLGFKMDGIIFEEKTANNWITEICRAIRGNYVINSNGKRSLYITAPSPSSYVYTDKNIELVSFGYRAYTGRVYNRGYLNYGYNVFNQTFMQVASFDNPESVAEIDEQLFEGNSYLLRDAGTAQSILDYTCKNSLVAAKTIVFSTQELPASARPGMIVTLNHSKVNGLCKITAIQRGENINRVEACAYDPNVFVSGSVSPQVSWTDGEKRISTAYEPASASGFTLSQEIVFNGTTSSIMIHGSFSLAENDMIAAGIDYSTDNLNWTSLGMVLNNKFDFHNAKPRVTYYFRLATVSAIAKTDYIYASITTVGDSVAPLSPLINVTQNFKNITVKCILNNPPDDLAYFKIYRGITAVFSEAVCVGSVSSKDGTAEYTEIVPSYATTYYYWAEAVDSWGNASENSACISITTAYIGADDISVYSLSAITANLGNVSVGGRNNVNGILSVYGAYGNKTVELNKSGISAIAGNIGGWIINSDSISTTNLEMKASGIIRTQDFASGLNGWSLDKDGSAEFNDVKVRGAIRGSVFETEEVSAIGGYQLVRPATVIEAEVALGDSVVVNVADGSIFAVGDIIRVKASLTDDYWATVTAKNQNSLALARDHGNVFAATKGQVIVNYGASGKGGIALDGETPRMEVFKHNGQPWNNLITLIRMGNLKGWGNYSIDEYGIAIGNQSSGYLAYDTTNGLRIGGSSASVGAALLADSAEAVDNWKTVKNGITYIDGGKIYVKSVTADKMSVSSLSAISAKLGNIVVGGSANINGKITVKNSNSTKVLTIDSSGISSDYFTLNADGGVFKGKILIEDNSPQNADYFAIIGQYPSSGWQYKECYINKRGVHFSSRTYSDSSLSSMTYQSDAGLTTHATYPTLHLDYKESASAATQLVILDPTQLFMGKTNESISIRPNGLWGEPSSVSSFSLSASGGLQVKKNSNSSFQLSSGGISAVVNGIHKYKSWTQLLDDNSNIAIGDIYRGFGDILGSANNQWKGKGTVQVTCIGSKKLRIQFCGMVTQKGTTGNYFIFGLPPAKIKQVTGFPFDIIFDFGGYWNLNWANNYGEQASLIAYGSLFAVNSGYATPARYYNANGAIGSYAANEGFWSPNGTVIHGEALAHW